MAELIKYKDHMSKIEKAENLDFNQNTGIKFGSNYIYRKWIKLNDQGCGIAQTNSAHFLFSLLTASLLAQYSASDKLVKFKQKDIDITC